MLFPSISILPIFRSIDLTWFFTWAVLQNDENQSRSFINDEF